MSHPIRAYTKPATDPSAQLLHLAQKGLVIPDQAAALAALKSLGYNRLLIYMRALQDPSKRFNAGAEFEDILYLYDFDRELRLLCLDAIERIEVALRSAISHTLSVQLGPHFYVETQHYEDIVGMKEFVGAAIKAESVAISHYFKKYNSPALPPIWTVMEAVTFGCLSRFYSRLHLSNRKLIAAELGHDEKVLVSWFRSLNVVRNMCAHHNRLWNASISVNKPLQTKQLKSEWSPGATSFADRAVVMAAPLKAINVGPNWHQRLRNFITGHPRIKPGAMGFSTGWEARQFWQ